MDEKIDENKTFDEDTHPRSKDNKEGKEGKNPFSQMSRVLSEDDLTSPITARFLLSQFDEFQELKKEYAKLKDNYHEKDKSCAIYEEQRKGNKAVEILNSTMLAIGPLLLGTLSYLIPTYGWSALSIIDCIAGGGLLLAGVFVKFFVKG